MTEREKEILQIIKNNPTISQEELAYDLGISRSGVAAHIHNLMKKGYIQGRGYILNSPNFATVVGGINIDVVGISAESLLLNNSNPGSISQFIGGSGRNIALALSKLEIHNNLIAVYGTDINGEKFIEDSHRQGLNTDTCHQISGYSTSSFLFIEDANNDIRIGIDDMRIQEQVTPELINKHLQLLKSSSVCIVDDNIPEETIKYIVNSVETPIIGKSVSANKVHKFLPVMDKLRILIVSRSELATLSEGYKQKKITVEEACQELQNQGLKRIIVIKSNGDFYFKGQDWEYKFERNWSPEYNTNGASAVFTAVLIWASAFAGMDEKEALHYAYCGAKTCFMTNESVFEGLSIELLNDIYEETFSK